MPTAWQPTPAPDQDRRNQTERASRPQLTLIEGLPGRRLYLRVRTRVLLTVLAGLLWAGLAAYLSVRWIDDLGQVVSLPAAALVVAGIAIVPGYLNAQLVASIMLDRPPPLRYSFDFPNVALLIAAYNERGSIEETIRYALRSDYPGQLKIVVADDGSTDGTEYLVHRMAAADERIRIVKSKHGGKARALNAALATVDAPLVATIDADTLLMPESLRRAVARMLGSPPDTVAVAGSVLVRNSRSNVLARMQEWDYFLAIASVKRQQALLQGTLVAQGAFSVYRTAALRAAGGWPDRIGEDIVLTWALIRGGGRTTFEPTAVAFTEVPRALGHFVRQRQRWARGMIEGIRDHGSALVGRRAMLAHSVAVNYLFPYLDGVYTLVFLPGVLLALSGNCMLVGPVTVAVLPLNALIASIMLWRQRHVFRELDLRIRRNYTGFAGYLLLYTPIMSPVSFVGYLKELAGAKRRWR